MELQEAWLHKMTLFCQELHEFLAAVPPDVSIACYASMDEATASRYPHMAEACDVARTQYMPGIDYSCFSEQVEDVYNMGVRACCLLNQHPALGVFQVVARTLESCRLPDLLHSIGDVECVIEKQGIPDTRVDLFFERPLNMCMALGAEHGLQRRCTAVLPAAAAAKKKAGDGAGGKDGCVCAESSC